MSRSHKWILVALSISIAVAASYTALDIAQHVHEASVGHRPGFGHGCRDFTEGDRALFSTKELGKGTGLGLSMVHGLALPLDG